MKPDEIEEKAVAFKADLAALTEAAKIGKATPAQILVQRARKEIEAAQRAGVKLEAIRTALEKQGISVKLSTLRSYLSRSRSGAGKKPRVDAADVSTAASSAKTSAADQPEEAQP